MLPRARLLLHLLKAFKMSSSEEHLLTVTPRLATCTLSTLELLHIVVFTSCSFINRTGFRCELLPQWKQTTGHRGLLILSPRSKSSPQFQPSGPARILHLYVLF